MGILRFEGFLFLIVIVLLGTLVLQGSLFDLGRVLGLGV